VVVCVGFLADTPERVGGKSSTPPGSYPSNIEVCIPGDLKTKKWCNLSSATKASAGQTAIGVKRKRVKMAAQKIRIRLKSYDHEVIDTSARKIVDTVTRAGATVVGPVPLPTEKNVVCVIRSPHKYKDSREHFEMRTHKRVIDIIDPTPKAVDSLMRLDLPADVNIEIKL